MALNRELIETLKEVVRLQYQAMGLEHSIADLNEKIQFSYQDYLPETIDRKVFEDEFIAEDKKEKVMFLLGCIIGVVFLLVLSITFIVSGILIDPSIIFTLGLGGIISTVVLIIKTKQGLDERKKSAVDKAEQKAQEIEKYNQSFNSELKSAKQNVEAYKEQVNQNNQKVDLIYQKISSLCAQIGLHTDYQEVNIVQKILDYLVKGRAETLRDAINLYEDEKARTIFQNQQRWFEQQRLDEAQKQTRIAQEQAYYLKQQAQAQAQAANRAAQAAERNARANERAADDIREMNNRDYWRN